MGILYNNYFKEYNTFINNKKLNYYSKFNNYIRFSYHIDLYCIEFFNYIILLNLYFETRLSFYKEKKKIIMEGESIDLYSFF